MFDKTIVKRIKAKEKVVMFFRKLRIMTCHHDMSMPLWHWKVFVWNQPVFHSIVMCIVLSGKILLYLWLTKIWLKSKLSSKTCWPTVSLHSALALCLQFCSWYKALAGSQANCSWATITSVHWAVQEDWRSQDMAAGGKGISYSNVAENGCRSKTPTLFT